MADITVLFGKKRGGVIGTLQLDATINETHTINNQITTYPIEEGSNISDHIRQLPDEITMSCFVTNSPINILQESNARIVKDATGKFSVKDLERSIVSNRVISAFEQLLAMSGRKIDGENIDPNGNITVVTGLRVYRNMAIVTISVPRNATTGDSLRFDITLRQIETISSETIILPDAKPEVKDTTSSTNKKGNVNTKQASAKQEENVSRAKSIYNKAKGLFAIRPGPQ